MATATNLYRGNRNYFRGGNGDGVWSYTDAAGINQGTGLTGVTTSSSNSKIWDPFILRGSSTAVFTAATSALIPTQTQTGYLSNASFGLTATTVSTMGAAELVALGSVIDSLDALTLNTFTLSFWVYATVTGTYCIRFAWNGSVQKTYIHEYTVSSSNTWQKIKVTLTPPNTITTPSDATCGLKIDWVILGGSNAQGTGNSWIAYNTTTYCTSNQVNGAATIGNVFLLNSIQLERGNIATAFEFENRAENRLKLLPWIESATSNGLNIAGAQVGATTVNATAQIYTKVATGGTVYVWNNSALLGSMHWVSTSNVATSRTTTATAYRDSVVFVNTTALEYLAQGTFCVDARATLFNF